MEFVREDGLRVFDGAIGTEVQKRSGEESDNLTDALNLGNPEIVEEIHRSYLEAGAEFLTTNTFSSNRIRLSRSGYEERAAELNERGAEIARTAIGEFFGDGGKGERFVAGSIGPTGETMVPLGDFRFDDFYSSFLEQAKSLSRGGVDWIIIETMESIREAKAALLAVQELEIPVISSMSYGNHGRTSYGVIPASSAVTLTRAGADVLGINCGTGPEPYPDLIETYHDYSNLPLLAEANAGTPKLRGGKVLYEITPEGYLEGMKPGLSYLAGVGSCCGSDPNFTRSLSSVSGDFQPSFRPKKVDGGGFIASSSSVVSLDEVLGMEEVEVHLDELPRIKGKLDDEKVNLLSFKGVSGAGDELEALLSRTFLQLRTKKPVGVVARAPQVIETFLKAYPGLPPVYLPGRKDGELVSLIRRYGGVLV
ncbi:MAG: homocysteine S-methyltransferase family protein [Candidatus Acetothermia bacterium]